MIRRGFWLGLGAVLGVTGYRRVTRLARTLAPAPREPRPAAGAGGRRVLAGAARAGHSTAEGVAFVRDVREGMAEYLDRQGQEAGAAPGSQQGQQGQHGQQGPPEPGSLPRDAAARRAAPRRPAP